MSIYLGTSKYSGSAGIAGGDASVIASNVTLSTSAQTYITVNNQGKTLQLPSAPPAGWLGSTSSTAAAGNHAHGHITSAGAVTQSGVAIGTGDSLLFVDSSNSSLIRKSSTTFPGNALVFLDGTGSFSSAPITSVSYTPTVTSSTSGAYVMGTLTINGSDTTLYGKDTTSSGGGGASYLGDLNDVSTTGATNGQALVYNGSSWAPGTVSGGGSWTPTQLSTGFRIWNLSTGIYQMPSSGTFYYSGTSGSSTLACTGGMLYIYEEDSVKQWYIMTDYSSGSNSYGAEVLISGYTTSTGGTHSFHYFQSTNEGDKYLGFTYYNSIISDLNSYNVRLYQPGICASTLSSSAIGKPANLTLNENTRFVMFTSKDYNNGVHSTPTQYLRQDLYLPSLGKHYYRYCSLVNSTPTVLTTTPNCDINGWVEEIPIPSYTSSDAGKCLQVATGGTSLQWATVSGGGGGGAEFNQVTAVYDTSAPLQGCSLYRANCAGNKRNFIFISLYSSHFPQGEELVVYLDNAVPYTDNYILINNGTQNTQVWCPDALAIFDSSTNHLNDFILLPADSNGNNVIDIPVGYSLWGVVNVGTGGSSAAAMLTFGGRFNEV